MTVDIGAASYLHRPYGPSTLTVLNGTENPISGLVIGLEVTYASGSFNPSRLATPMMHANDSPDLTAPWPTTTARAVTEYPTHTVQDVSQELTLTHPLAPRERRDLDLNWSELDPGNVTDHPGLVYDVVATIASAGLTGSITRSTITTAAL